MKYGFFYGVAGDRIALESALELVADCDRVVSLGDLVGPCRDGADPCLSWMLGAGSNPRFVFLAGRNERQLGRSEALPAPLRHGLKALPTIEILDGIALVGGAHSAPSKGGEPPMVAPLTVAAGLAGSRLWRAAGGLARVEQVLAPASFPLTGPKLRLDVGGPSSGPERETGPRVQVAVVDRSAGTLEWRVKTGVGIQPLRSIGAGKRSLRARRSHEGQQLLAV